MAELDGFDDENPYKNTLDGSFGRFGAGESFPLEFVLTTFPAHRLDELSFAREIAPKDVDFDLLMQRDIDEDRVRKKMQPYLAPRTTAGEIRSRALFFPPLLVAILPVVERGIQEHYPPERVEIDDEKLLVREWPGVFKVTLRKASGSDPYELTKDLPGGAKGSWSVNREPARLQYKPAQGLRLGAKLVVVDGQHRLAALKNVDESLLEHLAVPVCVVFPPFSTTSRASAAPGRIPSVPEVFRNLFVDVNNTAELVGGHFNILLSEDSVGSLVCRRFCSEILAHRDVEGLAVVEWNTKSRKDSTIITRGYSVTSIGVIEKALTTSFKRLLERALNLPEVRDDLYGNDSDEEEDRPNPVKWDTFSLDQKKILDAQIKKNVVPALEDLFFETEPFRSAVNCFREEIKELEGRAADKDATGNACQQVLNQILEYNPIISRRDDAYPENRYLAFVDSVRDRRDQLCHPAIGYAVFQRGMIEAWSDIFSGTSGFDLSARDAMTVLRSAIELQLFERSNLVSAAQPYCQDILYRGANVRPQEESRRAFAQLLVAAFGARPAAESAVEKLNIADRAVVNRLVDKLEGIGREAAFEYVGIYKSIRMRRFKSEYLISDELDDEEKERLNGAELKFAEQLREVKAKTRKKEDVTKEFDDLVEGHIRRYVEIASAALKKALNFDGDILPMTSQSSFIADGDLDGND